MDWLDLLAVQGTLKSLLQHHSSKASILQRSAFFTVQLLHPYMTTGKTIALTRWTFVGKVMCLLFNILSRLVIAFLPTIESVMPFSHLILCYPLFLLTPIPPSIKVFSNESTLNMRWPKYWSFSFSIIASKEHPGLISLEWTGWISLQSKGLSRVFSNTTV